MLLYYFQKMCISIRQFQNEKGEKNPTKKQHRRMGLSLQNTASGKYLLILQNINEYALEAKFQCSYQHPQEYMM